MKKRTHFLFFFLSIAFILNSCVEPYEYKSISFDSALVVEASITSELKSQKVKLSRTFKLKDDDLAFETGATVHITDNTGANYSFSETNDGTYISDSPFAAVSGNSYQLFIKTKDNRTYTSSSVQMKNNSPLQNLTAKAIVSNNGGIEKEGISIIAESFDATRKANYYRYEYEETYRILATHWSSKTLDVTSRTKPFSVRLVNRTIENKICYTTKSSTKIIQTETTDLSEDRVNFSVKFIEKSDFSIKNRYSILVKQYIQSREAYSFYKVLNDLSTSENLFSQIQTGTLIGNVFSEENTNENVLGFFEVNPVSSKRIFFNFSDFFQDGFPDHIEPCEILSPVLSLRYGNFSPLIKMIDEGKYIYYIDNPKTNEHLKGPYLMVTKSCGDCTVLGSNIKPSFWID